ncbi:MAG: hypothetical protein U0174_02175 [Polyangiaceae bacterium]
MPSPCNSASAEVDGTNGGLEKGLHDDPSMTADDEFRHAAVRAPRPARMYKRVEVATRR